jgi:hypothetical protein
MDSRRRRWIAALALYVAWVTVLGAMSLVSGRRPAQHQRVIAPP